MGACGKGSWRMRQVRSRQVSVLASSLRIPTQPASRLHISFLKTIQEQGSYVASWGSYVTMASWGPIGQLDLRW